MWEVAFESNVRGFPLHERSQGFFNPLSRRGRRRRAIGWGQRNGPYHWNWLIWKSRILIQTAREAPGGHNENWRGPQRMVISGARACHVPHSATDDAASRRAVAAHVASQTAANASRRRWQAMDVVWLHIFYLELMFSTATSRS